MISLRSWRKATLGAALLAALTLLGNPSQVHAEEEALFPDPSEETLLLQQPTVSDKHVAFVWGQDIWIASRDGGDARRLTSHRAYEASPYFSPDGSMIAFTGEYEGNRDVYVIAVDGGAPKRLTWHPGADIVRGWHPDGKRVVFGSGRASDAPVYRLFHASVDGGLPEALPMPRAARAAWKADGSRLAYTPISDPFYSWKRHRGGQMPPIWIYNPDTHDVTVVPSGNANNSYPSWAGGWLYFMSDRDGQMNLYRHNREGEPTQITNYKTYGIRRLSGNGDTIVFTRAGAVHLYDTKTEKVTRLSIRCRTDGGFRNPQWVSVGNAARNAAISPDGKRVAVEARGEILTFPRERGPVRNLSNSPGAHDRDPVWDPKGGRVAWFSDQNGDYQLLVRDRLGREEPKAYDLGGAGFYHDPQWSPDGKHIIFSDKANRLAYLTLESGKVTTISQTQGSLGVWRPFGVWSPDSAWIAFEKKDPQTTYNSVGLFEIASGETTELTDGFANADSPAFSTDGKHLFFQASVNAGKRSFGLDMSAGAARDANSRLYVAVLKKDGKNPLAGRSDETAVEKPKPKKKDEDKKDGDDKKDADEKGDDKGDEDKKDEGDKDAEKKKDEEKKDEEKAKPKSIDLEDLDQRILALPHGSGQFWGLNCVKGRLLFMERQGTSGWTFALKSFDFKSRKAAQLTTGVSALEVAAKGKHLLLKYGSTWAITNDKGAGRKNINTRAAKVRRDPAKEWPQILRETWRLQRDYFYDPQMHQIDWPAMWDRWSKLLPHVQHREELTMLQMEMMGELACGHMYVNGGQYPSKPSSIGVGLLGADFAVEGDNVVIARIYKGQNWNPGLRAPLTEPGVDVKAGDILVSVNGMPVSASDNPFAVFEGTSGQLVELTVKTGDGDERTSKVTTISNEGTLRRLAWIEGNRRRVDKLSGGRLAYIYMPDTGGRGMASFDRDFYSQLDKEGVVLDERFNGGGKIADYVIDVLARDVICYWMNREGWLGRTPVRHPGGAQGHGHQRPRRLRR